MRGVLLLVVVVLVVIIAGEKYDSPTSFCLHTIGDNTYPVQMLKSE